MFNIPQMSKLPVENACPYCDGAMKTTRMSCSSCQVSIDAEFADQPLSRLPVEHQRFIEMFVLAGGSLKEVAAQAGVSYPTVRNRLDKVIENLSEELAPNEGNKKSSKQEYQQPTPAQILKQI